MSVLNENTIIGASAAGGDYEIEQSLRLNIDTPKWIKRTPSSDSNRKTWTLSMWHKRGAVGRNLTEILFKGGGSGGSGIIAMHLTNSSYAAEDKIWLSFDGATGANPVTDRVFRDPSGWMHIVLRVDTTQSTVTDRARLYINGELIISTDYTFLWSTSWAGITQNSDWNVNKSGIEHSFGAHQTNQPLDGYLADIAFVDGQSLGPDSFGETGDYGEWKPIDVSGLTFGTNGYHLDFADSSALGNDANGSNNFTTVGIAATDQMIDSPTNNFCTWNPLNLPAAAVLSEGNTKASQTSNDRAATGTMAISSGKYYFEIYYTTARLPEIGLSPINQSYANAGATTNTGNFQFITNSGGLRTPAWTATSTTGLSAQTGTSVIGFAIDADAGKAWLTNASGTYFNSGNPATGSNPQATFDSDWLTQTGGGIVPFVGMYSGTASDVRINCGQDSSFAGAKTAQSNQDANSVGDFYYAVPSGFLALCTQNLPDATVIPSEHFNTVIYSGTGADNRVLSGVGFTPNLGIFKRRNGTGPPQFFDTLRGASQQLRSDSSAAESTQSNKQKTFTSDGYTLGTDAQINGSGGTYVAWNWKAGTAVSNTNGSATSQVSANVDAGFSIATFTLPTTATTIGHGLSKPPELVMQKGRVSGSAWWTFAKPVGNTKALRLDGTGTAGTSTNFWNNTDPTSTVVTIGANSGANNSWMMYCFHSVEGYSRISTYGGNGSTNGPFVYCGFKPAFLMLRNIGGGGEWIMQDDARQTFNADAAYNLSANRSVEENNGTYLGGPTNANNVDWLSNGFKIRADNGNCNASGGTFLFIAFAENPFKHTNAR